MFGVFGTTLIKYSNIQCMHCFTEQENWNFENDRIEVGVCVFVHEIVSACMGSLFFN